MGKSDASCQSRRDFFADGEGRGEAGAFDAEERDEVGNSVLGVDDEIGLLLAGAVKLWTDAGEVGRERAVGQSGPEAAHVLVEAADARFIDLVVFFRNEVEVGA